MIQKAGHGIQDTQNFIRNFVKEKGRPVGGTSVDIVLGEIVDQRILLCTVHKGQNPRIGILITHVSHGDGTHGKGHGKDPTENDKQKEHGKQSPTLEDTPNLAGRSDSLATLHGSITPPCLHNTNHQQDIQNSHPDAKDLGDVKRPFNLVDFCFVVVQVGGQIHQIFTNTGKFVHYDRYINLG